MVSSKVIHICHPSFTGCGAVGDDEIIFKIPTPKPGSSISRSASFYPLFVFDIYCATSNG